MYTDKITQAIAEAAKKILEGEKLHPNQQKIDVVDDEKIDGKDFAKLRAMKKEDVEQVEEDFSNEKRVRNRVARANDDHEYSQGVDREKRKEGLYDPIAINRLKKTDKAADAAHSGIKKTAVASFIKNRKGDGKVRTEEVEEMAQPSFSDLMESYREGGLKGFFENFQVVQEEPTNDEYTAEVKKAQAKSEGKDKADVAKAAVQAVQNEDVELDERALSSDETAEKERIVKSMKKGFEGFKDRYGKRAKEVMYATATKQAKED